MKKFIALTLAACLAIALCGCGAVSIPIPDLKPSAAPAATAAPAPTAKPTPAPTAAPTAAPTPEPTPAPAPVSNDGIRPEFKAAMDGYEAFFDEYVEFMKSYMENPADVSLLMRYASILVEYEKAMTGMEQLENSDLNNAELAYYIEATARIETKLLKVLG